MMWSHPGRTQAQSVITRERQVGIYGCVGAEKKSAFYSETDMGHESIVHLSVAIFLSKERGGRDLNQSTFPVNDLQAILETQRVPIFFF